MRFYAKITEIEIIIKVELRPRVKVNPKAEKNLRIQAKFLLLDSLSSLLKLAKLNDINLRKTKSDKNL